MSSEVLGFLAPFIVAVLGGGVILAVIDALLAPKWRAEHSEDPGAALERSAFAPIEDAVREGEERAVREWQQR